MMSKAIRVILVDDHPPLVDGIKSALNHTDTVSVVGEAGTGQELEQLLSETGVDVVVLDLSLPDRSGIDLVYMMQDRYPSIEVIILSMYNRSDYILESVRAGALGYMTKESPPAKLIEGIHAVCKGEYFFDQVSLKTVIERALEHPRRYYDIEDKAYEKLTGREQEIMRLLSEGFQVRRIAQNLSISYRTVENHRSSIFRKLKVNNLAELVHYAKKLGIIDFE
ncbi:MAG: response regulator transcription factor [Spirochaetia bacterium]